MDRLIATNSVPAGAADVAPLTGTPQFATNGNPGTGTPATVFPAYVFNAIQEELIAVIAAGGIIPNRANNVQVVAAIRALVKQSANLTDTGAVNAYTAVNPTPLVAGTWVNGVVQQVTIAHTNTGASTYAPDGLAAIPIYGLGLQALQGNEMFLGGTAILMKTTIASVNSGNPICILMECFGGAQQGAPATASNHLMQLGQAPQIQSTTASVASNALTATFNGTRLDFRSATLGSGAVNVRAVAAPISVVVPSGATLGTVSATQSRIVVLALDNAGTAELAVVNIAGGNNLDETTLINTTAISAGATAANVIYSTTARTGVPFRVVGYIESTQVTAGTWATAPSTVQGMGGQALAAMSSVGYSQTWQVVAGRTSGTTYYNTTGRPIAVMAVAQSATAGDFVMSVNGIQAGRTGQGTVNLSCGVYAVVPPGASYILSGPGTVVVTVWNELR